MARDLIKQLLMNKNYSGDPNNLMSLPAIDVTDPQISEMAAQATAPIQAQDLMSVGEPIPSDVPNDYVGVQPTKPTQAPSNPMAQYLQQGNMAGIADKLKQYSNKKDSEVEQLKKYANDYANAQQGTDFRPIAAWASGLTGNKQLYEAANAIAPESSAHKAKQILDNQIQIAKMQGDAKLATDLMRLQQGQQKADALTKRNDIYSNRYGLAMDNQSSHAVDTVLNDKQLFNHTQRIQGADRILGQLDSAERGEIVDTPQLLEDLNNEYKALVTGRNNAPEGSSERSSYNTAASKIAYISQAISSDPKSINSPKILNQLRNSVSELKVNYQKAVDLRGDTLQREFRHNPQAQEAQKRAISDMKNTYGTGTKGPAKQIQSQDNLENMSDEELMQMYQGGQ